MRRCLGTHGPGADVSPSDSPSGASITKSHVNRAPRYPVSPRRSKMVPHLAVLLSTSPGSEPHRDDGLGSTDSKHRSTDAEQVTVCEALTLSLSLSCHPKRAGELDHESDRLPAVCLSDCSFSTRITHGTDRRPSTISHKGNARGPIAFLLRPLRHLTAKWQLAPAPTTLVFAFSYPASTTAGDFFFSNKAKHRQRKSMGPARSPILIYGPVSWVPTSCPHFQIQVSGSLNSFMTRCLARSLSCRRRPPRRLVDHFSQRRSGEEKRKARGGFGGRQHRLEEERRVRREKVRAGQGSITQRLMRTKPTCSFTNHNPHTLCVPWINPTQTPAPNFPQRPPFAPTPHSRIRYMIAQ